MKLETVHEYLSQNGLPVTWDDDNTRIRLESSTVALSNIVFLTVYRRSDSSISVGSDDFVYLSVATHRDLDILIDSYLEASSIEHCDLSSAKIVRSRRLRYAIDRRKRLSDL
jgi:diphthamide synthase subunit DPH2